MAGPGIDDPLIIDCPADDWTLVGENEVWGHIYKMDSKPNVYLYTYRITGNAAPTSSDEGVSIFLGKNNQLIITGEGVDVYIMPVGDAGKIRVDWYI